MTQPNNTLVIQPEIVTAPSVSNLSVSQVGTGMFSVTMQVIMVVRFPSDAATSSPMVINTDQVAPQIPPIPSTTVQTTEALVYGNGELPDPSNGETECFEAFVQVHGYIPPTRDVLIQWATSSQGGA